MNSTLRGRGPRTIGSLAVVLLAGAALLAPAAGAASVRSLAAGEAELGYWTDTEIVIADGAGTQIRTFPDLPKFDLNGGVFAGEIPGKRRGAAHVDAFDIATGERLYRIRNGRLPVVSAEGRKVFFFPTFHRDQYAESVWMRTAKGRVRRVILFKAGPGFPGVPHGMSAGAFPLDIAVDEQGRTLAVVAGLEPLRAFDVWVVDVKTREAFRVTRGRNSHNPSLSPDGSQLAVRVESPDPCPDPLYGEILVGKIRLITLYTEHSEFLSEWSCDLYYDTPRWIDDQTLIAVRVTKDETEELGYDLDIVKFDVPTGTITEVVTEGNPCCITASPSLGKVAYMFSDRDGFAVVDVATGAVTDHPGNVYVPHLSGQNRL
ncbi:MAG TPA: hypothetical protein VJ927_01055 [Actinomycetota bacterium]|nr:hypothetical protein [Actinomycetota bacterium]